jgi:hypothetical protein
MEYTPENLRTLYVMGMGYGTEGGNTPYKITVCKRNGAVYENSGYTIGVIQRDFGQMTEAEIGKFVDLVAKGAGAKFSLDRNEIIRRLKTHGSDLEDLPATDKKRINDFLVVPENRQKFFLAFEKPVMDRNIEGLSGKRADENKRGVNDIITHPDFRDKFSNMSKDDQMRTIVMLDKVANQGGFYGPLQKGFPALNTIPKDKFNADNIREKLIHTSGFSKALRDGIKQADCIGKVFARIEKSESLSGLLKAGTSVQTFDTSTVESNPDLKFLSVLSKNSVGKGNKVNPEITKFIDNVEAKRGTLLKKDGKALGVNKDGVKFIVDLKSRNLDTIKKTANGWEPASSDEFIKKVAVGKGKKSKETWALVEPGDIKKTVAPETQKVKGETAQEAARPEEGWGSKMKGFMREFLDKYYAPTEAKNSEPTEQPKADSVASTAQSIEKDSTQGIGEDWIKEFGKMAPDATVAQQRQAGINASVAQMLLAGSNKSPEEQAKIMEIANRITANHIQAGSEIEKTKMYDPEAEPARVVRTFTLEDLQKSQSQEKGIERQRSMDYGA